MSSPAAVRRNLRHRILNPWVQIQIVHPGVKVLNLKPTGVGGSGRVVRRGRQDDNAYVTRDPDLADRRPESPAAHCHGDVPPTRVDVRPRAVRGVLAGAVLAVPLWGLIVLFVRFLLGWRP